MAFGTSIFLFAAGAVLTWGVTVTAEGVNLDAIGVILMIVGVAGFLVSSLFFASWAPFRRDRRTVIREYDDGRTRRQEEHTAS